jgi:hypothetical protein
MHQVRLGRACELSVLFAPTALTRGMFLLVLQAAPAKPAETYRKWPAKQAQNTEKRDNSQALPRLSSALDKREISLLYFFTSA